jgi:hypothetical protein
MPYQSWAGLLNPSAQLTGAGAILSTATTATISPQYTGATGTLLDVPVQPGGQPLGFYPGLVLRVRARGYLTSTGTSTTATILLAANANNAGTYTTLATSAGFATGTGAITGGQWILDGFIRCTNVATSGNTISTQAEMSVAPVAAQTFGTASPGLNICLPNASGETAAAINTTQLQGIALRATLAGANATIACTQWIVEALD